MIIVRGSGRKLWLVAPTCKQEVTYRRKDTGKWRALTRKRAGPQHNPKLEHGASNECRRSRTLQKEPMNLGSEEGRRREGIRGPLEARMERWSCCNSHGVLLLSTRLRNVDVDK